MDNQTCLANFGAPFEIDWNGKKLKVLYRVQRIKAKFERWAKDRSLQEIISRKNLLDAKEYRELLDAKFAEFETDAYAYDSPKLQALRDAEEGKLAHVRTFVEGAENWTNEELFDFLLEKGEDLNAYVQACSARVDSLLKDLGEKPDPKEVRRRLKAAGMWE